MSERARTDDDLGLKPPRSRLTQEKRIWIGRALGVNLDTLVALDLKTTTTQQSADQAVPMLLHQVMEITAPLKNLPPAQTPELSAALLSLHNIRSELGGKPTPQVIVLMRREIDALPALVNTAVVSVTQLQQRQQTLIEKAKDLTYAEEASQDTEGKLIKEFETQQTAVAGAFQEGPLSGQQIKTAETALQAAVTAAELIAKAVHERLSKRLTELVLAAGKLAYTKDVDERAEGGLIGSFNQQRDAVAVAQSKNKLTNKDIQQAEESLKQATETAEAIDKAVEERHAQWAQTIRERADKMIKGFTSQDLDPALWAKPKATREQIDKELA